MDRPLYIYAVLLAPLLFVLAVLRFLQVVRQTHAGKRRRQAPLHKVKEEQLCRLVAFLGSGGHTGEMIRLLYGLDFDKYPTRIYLVSSGDNLSLAKVKDLEAIKAKNDGQSSGQIPRARRVHQSFFTAPFTTLTSLWTCFWLFTLPAFTSSNGAADLILLNGPGSCVPIVLAAFVPRLFGLHSPQTVYVESLARVKRLSLSGKILQFFVDRFLVQWPTLADKEGSASSSSFRARREYKGLLV